MGGEHGDAGKYELDESCHPPTGLDAQKKTLGASERDEAARAAWREQARQLGKPTIGVRGRMQFQHRADPSACAGATGPASRGQGAAQRWGQHHLDGVPLFTRHGRSARLGKGLLMPRP